ncbi:hypothetical protein [Mycolicibacterium goodii]|uniref:hypothetical protein n=1 Tax=Mycolicibacterium goodii TaxID=134601 RepID=UPI0010549FD0|nr:hypothetical protein [Mycolicibacterium goodii]
MTAFNAGIDQREFGGRGSTRSVQFDEIGVDYLAIVVGAEVSVGGSRPSVSRAGGAAASGRRGPRRTFTTLVTDEPDVVADVSAGIYKLSRYRIVAWVGPPHKSTILCR